MLSTTLQCLAIVCTSLSAGGIFVFPLLVSAFIEHLGLTQSQLSTIALAGMAGQYPFSSLVGILSDRCGPRFCSLLAALMFFAAFGLSALEISSAPEHSERSNTAVSQRLTVYFAMAGLATVLSYFSFVFSATKTFTRYFTLASGLTMSLFGLSPLFLSYLGSNFFSDPTTGTLDVTRFLQFLAAFAGVAHLFGACALTVPSTPATTSPSDTTDIPDERSRLIEREISSECTTGTDPRDKSTLELLRDLNFWILALYMVMILGACEMIMSNVGTIVLSLPSELVQTVAIKDDQSAAFQVKILSIANTVSRLLIGPFADFASPVFSYEHLQGFTTVRKHHISRIVFLSGASSLLALTCSWMAFGAQTRHDVWLLSVGTGITYGSVFTVLPGVSCSIWGMQNLARNFGILTYSPFVGTTLYSYLYALIVERHSPKGTACQGRICWESTFIFCLGTSLAALAMSAILWRNWSGRT
ncbi:hypothetical protein GYMLUDRAFT_226757 [Collybiopsis luxurians FD-317 M1]|uniref:MFS general substrate transporter n=1 Tax=Collybiopsis luxurians FD-317 M1 TaxID=944289 RepID=A0A0D0B8A8_9AGAR|nr:hypothetical protein GYMLUDRAFT_226757 [Collybiopsis luxurians FD-317 M1]